MNALLIGLGLGLVGGLAPGPLLPLLVSTSLEKGFRAGVRIAFAPLFTDLPIIFGVVVILSYLPESGLKWLGIIGGAFISFLGVRMFRRGGKPGQKPKSEDDQEPAIALGKGILINFLSISAWIFWLVVGGPFFVRAWNQGVGNALLFLAGYFGLAIGIKSVIAWMVASQRGSLGGNWRGRLIKICGVGLVVAGGVLTWQALEGNFEKLVQKQQQEQVPLEVLQVPLIQ